MAGDEVLRARVDPQLSRKVHRWAREHDTNVSEAVRIALRQLVEERQRLRQIKRALKEFDEYDQEGLFDPPAGETKAKGFR